MIIDTHCHLNTMLNKTFDTPLSIDNCKEAQKIIEEAHVHDVAVLINVGTSFIESNNSVMLARRYPSIYASVGIHPNDCTPTWYNDLEKIAAMVQEKKDNKIVALGECGLDYHYPAYHEERQKEALRAHIELAIANDLALVIHTRDAGEEVLTILQEYRSSSLRGTIHCFSETLHFARKAIDLGFVLGIGGTITYPKNEHLRATLKTIGLDHCVLETDAPFLPPQIIRGKTNHPLYTQTVAQYIAKLVDVDYATVEITTKNALRIFGITM